MCQLWIISNYDKISKFTSDQRVHSSFFARILSSVEQREGGWTDARTQKDKIEINCVS